MAPCLLPKVPLGLNCPPAVISLLVGTQFALEAMMTTVMLLPAGMLSTGAMQSSAFALSLASMLVPVLQRGHDAIIVQGLKLLRKESDFSIKGALFATAGL